MRKKVNSVAINKILGYMSKIYLFVEVDLCIYICGDCATGLTDAFLSITNLLQNLVTNQL